MRRSEGTSTPLTYAGFYGALFDAPTSVITVVWTHPGDYQGVTFLFTEAQAVLPVSEPASLALLGTGILGLLAVRRRHCQSQGGPAAY